MQLRSKPMLLLTLFLFFSACNLTNSIESTPPTECSKIGVQCQLPNGPLGVCQSAPCSEGQAPPCFVCTSQH